ncbi:MAG: hypothetical protein J5518_01445 [Lachnospiraceae bacterium]|nr:hypothetical protein [Lachnospiraceae bacterium]
MNKNKSGGINVGTSSILVTFVLLCLVTFAALSFLSANSDYRLSQQTAKRTTEYYDANRFAELYMANIEGLLSKCYARSGSESDYMKEVPKLFADNDSITVNTDSSPVTLSYDVKVNDTQKLHVCLAVAYPAKGNDALFHIVSWRTQNVDIWATEEGSLLNDGDIRFMEFE